MAYKKREAELERKFYRNRMALIAIGSTAPINKQIVASLSALAWHFKQSYKTDAVAYYVSKKVYNEDLKRIELQEARLEKGGEFEAEALEAIKELKEYLWIIGGSKVRDNRKTRVY